MFAEDEATSNTSVIKAPYRQIATHTYPQSTSRDIATKKLLLIRLACRILDLI